MSTAAIGLFLKFISMPRNFFIALATVFYRGLVVGMKHCSNCVHCDYNLVARYVKGAEKYHCRINHTEIYAPMLSGFGCEYYKKLSRKGAYL